MVDRFWRLESPTSQRKRAEWDHDKMKLEVVTCPADPGVEYEGKRYPAHQREGKRLTDLHVILNDGEVEDFVWTWYSECLMQDRTLNLLCEHRFTGFEVKPVTARFKTSREQPPKLWELVVTGWAGMAHPASGIRLDETKSCAVCGHLRYTGLVHPERLIDETKWDGSDFFMVWPMSTHVFVIDQVVKAIREHELAGVRIVPVSELKPTDGYTPGRLSYSMPEKRARELGEPLGIY